MLLDAHLHDTLLAVTSHLPHITAAALVHVFAQTNARSSVAEQLIGGGWRDTTRIAAGSAEMWRDICLDNAPAITQSLDRIAGRIARAAPLDS